jgi:hypothetical protein
MPALLLIVLFIGLLAGTILSMSRHPKRTGGQTLSIELPKTPPLPPFRRHVFFTGAERSFYEILRRLTPNHTVFAKVRLADLVFIPGKLERQHYLNQLDRKQVDFVVCDKSLEPVVAIKLDNKILATPEARSRDDFLEEVLAAAAVPVIRLGNYKRLTFDDIHQLIAPYLRIGTPFV